MLSQAALEIMAESRAEGMAQRLSQGISRGKADMLLRLMRRRFDNVSPAVEQRVLMAEADDLDRWARRSSMQARSKTCSHRHGIRGPAKGDVAPKRHEGAKCARHLPRTLPYPLIALIYRNAAPCFPCAQYAGQPRP